MGGEARNSFFPVCTYTSAMGYKGSHCSGLAPARLGMMNIGKPCAGKPHARFDEGGQARACSLLYPCSLSRLLILAIVYQSYVRILFGPPARIGDWKDTELSRLVCWSVVSTGIHGSLAEAVSTASIAS